MDAVLLLFLSRSVSSGRPTGTRKTHSTWSPPYSDHPADVRLQGLSLVAGGSSYGRREEPSQPATAIGLFLVTADHGRHGG